MYRAVCSQWITRLMYRAVFGQWIAEFRLVVRGPQQHLFNPFTLFFFSSASWKTCNFPSSGPNLSISRRFLFGKVHQASRMSPSVYNFVTSDKELPFIIFVGGLKSTGSNLCPNLFLTLSSSDGDMLLWMRFFTAGKQKKKLGWLGLLRAQRYVCFPFVGL